MVGPPAVIVGVAGKAFTVTITCELTVVDPSKTATKYVVLTVGLAIGSAILEVNPTGFEVHV